MLLGLATFTFIHVALSLLGLIAGFVVLGGFIARVWLEGWITIFLASTVLTNATGFGFPFIRLLPSHIVAALSLVILAVALLARYAKRLEGPWRRVLAWTVVLALYFNVFVLIAQLFRKIPALIVLAPTQQSPFFGLTQLAVVGLFVVLGRPALRGALQSGAPRS